VTRLRRGDLTNLALFSARQCSLFAGLAGAARASFAGTRPRRQRRKAAPAARTASTWNADAWNAAQDPRFNFTSRNGFYSADKH
jgi:hypothetical protein